MEQRTPFGTETVANATPRVSSYQYDFGGRLVQETYPSGRIVKNDFEADGDLSRVSSKANQTATERLYANGFSFTASGGISRMRLGSGKWETAKFNERQQITELGLGSSGADASLWKVNYEYGELENGSVTDSKNTGNIARQTLTFAGLANPIVQSYKYDALDRIVEAKETSGTGTNATENWKQTWSYDRFGNRETFSQNVATQNGTQTLAINNITNPTIDPNTNRFNDNQGYLYDKNGNIKQDTTLDVSGNPMVRQYVFNLENKQTEVKDGNGVLIGKYFYDGEGKRVKKVTQTETTVFVYSSGKLIAEYSTQAPQNPTTSYTTSDHLGTPRIITDASGQVKSRRDFLPFGEEIGVNTAQTPNRASIQAYNVIDNVRQKFTGYQKDNETELDFAEARMYQSQHARFTAVDPLLASGKNANPQTFNRYVYVGNSPLIRVDKDGLIWLEVSRGGYRIPVWKDGNTLSKGEKEWSGGPVYYAQNTLNWVALPPNGGTTEIRSFARQENALWQYYEWTNFSGYGSVPVLGNFLYGLAGMKKGEVGGALSGFGLTSFQVATLPKTAAGWLVEFAFSADDYIAKNKEINGDNKPLVSVASFSGVIRVGKVPNTDSELITKGVHVHAYVGRNRTQVEVSVRVGENGELIYEAIGKNGRNSSLAKQAIEIAKEQVENNSNFRNNLIRTTEGFVENTRSHPNQVRQMLTEGFQSVLDALRNIRR